MAATHGNPLQRLIEHGQSVWYDNLSRKGLVEGELKRLIDTSGVVGVTSNPTIFDKAISGSDTYDDQIRRLAEHGRTTDEIYEALVVDDIQQATDLLRPVYDRADNAGDGFVSLEVSPTLAHDTEGTLADARRLWTRVNRPNLMIKVPGTPEGNPAIEELLFEGVNVNITLLFSLDAYRAVAHAYIRALQRRVEAGLPIDSIFSVASFFVSRVDTEGDKRLDAIANAGGEHAQHAADLRGKLAVANAKLAYVAFRDIFESPEFKALQDRGAHVQRPLWASTSTKNAAYSDTLYVDELIGPHTVQTLAPASIDAFGDHGTLANTLESDLDAARQVFADLETVGVSYDEITDTLVREGVASFAASFTKLLNGLEEKRQQAVAAATQARAAAVEPMAEAVNDALAELAREGVPQRLQDRDPSLWTEERVEQVSIAQRLGWLPVVDRMRGEARNGDFSAFQAEVRERGYQHAVLLGMGGSSLAPEVFSLLYPCADGYPDLHVLDTTNPDTIQRCLDQIDGQRTLVIVSTKSGTTVETMSLFHTFLTRPGAQAGDFIAITDAGTRLEQEATAAGFWRIFTNPADIGGRYSALSYFGLVAAAAAGVDIDDLLERAAEVLPIHDVWHPGVWLGAVMGAAHRSGRDKLTLVSTSDWLPFGDWLEQLIAESTGKQGVGIIPVIGEPVGAPDAYGEDRLFVYLRGAAATADLDASVAALRASGQPVVHIDLDGPQAVGSELVRWEIATAVAGGLLGINPFDESNVQEAKDATNAVLATPDTEIPASTPVEDAAAALLGMLKSRGYVALLAYVDPTPEVKSALADLRNALRKVSHQATTLGYGPRYLHSTGQLHKGGRESGAFLQIVSEPATDIQIPDAPYDFATLFAAQSSGDALTLVKHGLSFVRVTTGSDPLPTLRALTEAARNST